MAKTSKKTEDASFFQVPRLMIQSQAFRTLDAASKVVLFEMMNAFTGFNNGFISMSHRQIADASGLSRATADKAVKELIARGFIIRTWKGRRIDHTKKVASQWEVTCYIKTDADNRIQKPSNDFLRWDGKPVNIDGIDLEAFAKAEAEAKVIDKTFTELKVLGPKSEPLDIPTTYEHIFAEDYECEDIPF